MDEAHQGTGVGSMAALACVVKSLVRLFQTHLCTSSPPCYLSHWSPTCMNYLGKSWGSRKWLGPSCLPGTYQVLMYFSLCPSRARWSLFTRVSCGEVTSLSPNPRENQEMRDSEQRDGTPSFYRKKRVFICGSTDQNYLQTFMIFCFFSSHMWQRIISLAILKPQGGILKVLECRGSKGCLGNVQDHI